MHVGRSANLDQAAADAADVLLGAADAANVLLQMAMRSLLACMLLRYSAEQLPSKA